MSICPDTYYTSTCKSGYKYDTLAVDHNGVKCTVYTAPAPKNNTGYAIFNQKWIAEWPSENKETCCSPYYDPKPPTDGLTHQQRCAPTWCPFQKNCYDAKITGEFCKTNLSDPTCFQIVKDNYTRTTRKPEWVLEYVQLLHRAHRQTSDSQGNKPKPLNYTKLQASKAELDEFVACLDEQENLFPECFGVKCGNSEQAYLTDNMIKTLDAGCPTVCGLLRINVQNSENINIDMNKVEQNCNINETQEIHKIINENNQTPSSSQNEHNNNNNNNTSPTNPTDIDNKSLITLNWKYALIGLSILIIIILIMAFILLRKNETSSKNE